MKILGLLVVATILVTGAQSGPVAGKYQSVLINSDNVRSLATFEDNSISVSQRAISFGEGSNTYDKLLVIPLAAPGKLDRYATIRINVGLQPSAGTRHNPIMGIADGTNENSMWLLSGDRDQACQAFNGQHDGNTRPTGYAVPAHYTLLFSPHNRYAACETAQNQQGGYVNTMTFNDQMDITKGLNFVLRRDASTEQYTFYYFLVEILQ